MSLGPFPACVLNKISLLALVSNPLARGDAVGKALRVGRHHDRGQAARGPKLRQPLQGELRVGPVLYSVGMGVELIF